MEPSDADQDVGSAFAAWAGHFGPMQAVPVQTLQVLVQTLQAGAAVGVAFDGSSLGCLLAEALLEVDFLILGKTKALIGERVSLRTKNLLR